jgi:hypothetical protein
MASASSDTRDLAIADFFKALTELVAMVKPLVKKAVDDGLRVKSSPGAAD